MAQYDLLLVQNTHPSGIEYTEKTVNIDKGSLLSATAAGVPTVLAAGADGYQLVTDSAQTTGLKWQAIGGGHTQNTDTGTTNASFTVNSGSVIGKIILSATSGASNNTLTLTNAAITASDKTITFPNATGTVALTNNKLSVFAATTSAELAGVISDETGTDKLVFNTTPSFVTSVDTSSASFDVFNTTATTINAFNAATTLIIGSTGITASTTNIVTGAVAAATTKAINLGTGGAASSTTNIIVGSANGGTTTINSPTTAINSTTISTTSTSLTAFAGATSLLTIGGTGAAAVFAIPSTLEQSSTTGALTVAGGVYIAKKLNVAGTLSTTSPDFTTSITTSSTSFTAFAGATTLLTLGGTGASASTFYPSTLDATSSITGAIRTSGGISAAKALNIGTTITAGTTMASGANGGTGGQLTLFGVTSGSGVLKVNAVAGAGIVFQLPSANGSNTNLLQTDGAGVTSWVAAPAGMSYPGAGIGNSTGSAWGTSYTTTGSGTVLALATSPAFVTSVVGSASFDAFNTVSTTLNIGGAATTLTVGGTPTTAITHNYSTNATATATTKTVNIGTGGAVGSTSNINLGSANGGTVTVNKHLVVSGDLTVNGTTTTVNTETINLADNIITVNSNYSGSSPSENGGIEVERGTITSASLIWDESVDLWKAGLVGTETEISLLGHQHWITAPATKTSSGTLGTLAYDGNFFYICTATNTWKRIPLATNW